jgi:hypothetical protein
MKNHLSFTITISLTLVASVAVGNPQHELPAPESGFWQLKETETSSYGKRESNTIACIDKIKERAKDAYQNREESCKITHHSVHGEKIEVTKICNGLGFEMRVESRFSGDLSTQFFMEKKLVQSTPHLEKLVGKTWTVQYERLGDCPKAVGIGDSVLQSDGRTTKFNRYKHLKDNSKVENKNALP